MAGALTAAIAAAFAGSAAVVPDDYFEYTTLLLPGNGTNGAQNNTFLDGSTNNFTITRNGNTTQGTFSPFSQTGWGNYFDGTGDSLTIPSGSSISGTGNFTVEFWIYPTTFASGYQVPYINETSGGFAVLLNSTGTLSYGRALVAADGTTTGTVTFNQWNHVAFVRSGTGSNQFICYINGSSAGSFTNSTNYSSGIVRLGTDSGGTSFPFLGYLSNVRNVTIAVYTGAFTPPTSPLTATQSAGTNISAITGTQTSLLTCQSNRFIDNSTNNFTITRNGDTRVVAFSPFNPTASWSAATNGGSGYFDGSGDYLSAASNTAFAFGTGEWTIECWVYASAIDVTSVFFSCGTNGAQLGTNASGNLAIAQTNVSFELNSSTALPLNQWNHVAAVRNSSNSSSIFLNGTRIANATITTNYSSSGTAYANYNPSSAGSDFTGYMSGLRVVKGTAVYDPTQTSITVPTAPLTAITNTSLLLNFTNAGIYDATSKNDLETVGNAQISTTQSKFGGSSMYFDGTGDWLLSTPSVINDFGTGNFTIEAWIYMTSTSNYFYIYNSSNANFNSPNFTFLYDTSLGLRMYAHSGTYTVNQGSTSGWAANTWYYVALVRNGGTITIYRNGTSLASGSTFSGVSFGSATAPLQIGGSSPDSRSNNGYIQDLRVSRYARDVTTTPTAAFPTL